jgi:subtilisin family serine protease
MKLNFTLAIAAAPLALLALPAQAQVAGDIIADSYICTFKAGSVGRGAEMSEANRSVNANGGRLDHVYSASIRGFAAHMPAQALGRMMASNPNIQTCEPDRVATLGQVRAAAQPGGVIAQAQSLPWGIARVGGGTITSASTAWVIDSGIQLDHPDLNVDTVRSRSFLGSRTTPADQNGHGTHVSGTIAARDNGIGVVGVAPGAKLVAVRVLDRRGSGSNSGVIAGVDYVAANGQPGDVANMSLGGGVSSALDNAVIAAAARGIRFTLAAGNENANANLSSPARANGANIYTVSAFQAGDIRSTFSNFGNPPVDYAEPGQAILSTWLSSGYNTISGTSMAAPHLAGILLLGPVRIDGTVSGDPDGNPDPIGVH